MGSWRDEVEGAVRRQAAKSADGGFTRQQIIDEELDAIVAECGSEGATPTQTLSRVLQEMRRDGVIEFVDDQGSYRLIA